MKKIFLLALSSLIFAVSCSKDDGQGDGGDDNQPAVTLITPDVSVRIADPLSSNPFTGALEIYPCDEASSIYYGNYVNGKLTVFNGFYLIENGDVYGEYNRALHLPAGVYNMVYWGTPQSDEPTHNKPQIVIPGVSAGSDLSKLYFSLRSVGTDVYSPVYDLVHAVKSAHIGTDPLQTSLTRVGAGLKISVTQSDGSAFVPEIVSVVVKIGNIAEKVNFYTGEAENLTKTVQFELSRSEDGLSYGNITVMLFPSAANPPLTLVITLQDGTTFTLQKKLSSTLSPNTRLTLNVTVGKILPDGKPGDFTYDDWNEESETIDFPLVD